MLPVGERVTARRCRRRARRALRAQQPPPRRAAGTAAAAADAGDPEGYTAGHRRTSAEAGPRRLADGPRAPTTAGATARSTRSRRRTSRRLQPAWVFSTGATNGHEAPPIVNNGVMFVVDAGQPGDRARGEDGRAAVALSSGRCPRTRSCMHPTSRGVALYGDKVLLRGGRRRCWSRSTPDRQGGVDRARSPTTSSGYYMTLAPLVAERQGDGRRLGRRASASAASSPPTMPRPASRRGRPTPCRRRASPAARPGRRATSGRRAARRSG